jgi:hypothetical protein
MARIRCRWNIPAKYKSGRALPPADMAGFELFMRVAGAPAFTSVGKLGPAVVEHTLDVDATGTYEFQLTATTKNGKVCDPPATGSVTIAETTGPETPTLTVDLV